MRSEEVVSKDPSAVGERIRVLRERLGLTQERLAARIGVAFPTVNRWENGHTQPSPLAMRQIEALAMQVLDVDARRGASEVPPEVTG